eukprot:TRINITY_DN6398_c0_g1_i1.p1 TRINITY_DN6398_c0_g1~~TRINITY_DN6398_c0_g1_i1.p1  ORF type:complete len:243 (-),score=48.00 TRINITY_DN6398_c0_g1_i1:831-1559(-)
MPTSNEETTSSSLLDANAAFLASLSSATKMQSLFSDFKRFLLQSSIIEGVIPILAILIWISGNMSFWWVFMFIVNQAHAISGLALLTCVPDMNVFMKALFEGEQALERATVDISSKMLTTQNKAIIATYLGLSLFNVLWNFMGFVIVISSFSGYYDSDGDLFGILFNIAFMIINLMVVAWIPALKWNLPNKLWEKLQGLSEPVISKLPDLSKLWPQQNNSDDFVEMNPGNGEAPKFPVVNNV